MQHALLVPALLTCSVGCSIRLAAGPTVNGEGRVGAQGMLTMGVSWETQSSRVWTVAGQAGGGISPAHDAVAILALAADYAPDAEAMWRVGGRGGSYMRADLDGYLGLAAALLPWRWSSNDGYHEQTKFDLFPDSYSALGVELQGSVLFANETTWLGWAALTFEMSMPKESRPDFVPSEPTRREEAPERAVVQTCSTERPCMGPGGCRPPSRDVPCGPAGCQEWNRSCESDDACDPGEVCGPDRSIQFGFRQCYPRACTVTADCGAHDLICDPVVRICTNRPCRSSVDCDGVCVLDLCWPTAGMCDWYGPPP